MTEPTPVTDDAAPPVGQSSVWADAWRYLRTNPLFLTGCTIMIVMVTMALFPALFAGGADPHRLRPVDVAAGRRVPRTGSASICRGCDYYANVVYGARTSVAIGVLTVIGCSSSGAGRGAGRLLRRLDRLGAGPGDRRVLRHSHCSWGR